MDFDRPFMVGNQVPPSRTSSSVDGFHNCHMDVDTHANCDPVPRNCRRNPPLDLKSGSRLELGSQWPDGHLSRCDLVLEGAWIAHRLFRGFEKVFADAGGCWMCHGCRNGPHVTADRRFCCVGVEGPGFLCSCPDEEICCVCCLGVCCLCSCPEEPCQLRKLEVPEGPAARFLGMARDWRGCEVRLRYCELIKPPTGQEGLTAILPNALLCFMVDEVMPYAAARERLRRLVCLDCPVKSFPVLLVEFFVAEGTVAC